VRPALRFLLGLTGLLLLGFTAQALHAYHATITELRYNAGKKQLELAIKVFTDDFEKALSQGQPRAVAMDEKTTRPQVLSEAYLRHTVEVRTTTGTLLPLKFLGLQKEKDGYWLYCKVALPGPVAGVQLRQAMLLDVFADETNIVNVEANGQKQSALFRAGHEQQPISW
jgi:hypothetical protein